MAPAVLELVWPAQAVIEALQDVDLLATWLARRLKQELVGSPGQPQTLEELQHHWFGEEARSLFLLRRSQLSQVLVSVLQLHDGHLAQELWFRLQAGDADFMDLAHLGCGPERHQHGRIGPLPMGQLDPALAYLLERSQPGELAPPLENGDGSVLLLRLEQRWPACFDPPTRQALEQELYGNWLQGQLDLALAAAPLPGQTLTLELPGP